jgi:hypothetical protein
MMLISLAPTPSASIPASIPPSHTLTLKIQAAATPEISAITISKKPRPVSRSKQAKRAAFTSRLLMALFGGIALIVPTVVMVKAGSSVNKNLITASVATVIFALVLAFGASDSTGKDVLGATAAYTAVLVVFIGTSVSGP